MRRLALIALVSSGCIPAKTQLLRELHDGLDEVSTSESAEMPFRAKTPDLGPLIGLDRDEIGDELGAGDCDPTQGGGQRCVYRFSYDPAVQSQPPLILELDFDKKDRCTGARWSELR